MIPKPDNRFFFAAFVFSGASPVARFAAFIVRSVAATRFFPRPGRLFGGLIASTTIFRLRLAKRFLGRLFVGRIRCPSQVLVVGTCYLFPSSAVLARSAL